jgi:PleD family two-component response regulator
MTVNEVIKAADDALYSAKNIGRNKAVVYTNTIP